MNRPGSERARTSQTLARGLQVLDCFLTGVERELGIKDLAVRLNLPQTNVARLVATLVEGGYLVQQPATRQYRLGLRAYLLGLRANPAEELRRIAHPVLERLARETGETVSLSVIDPASLEGVCIASIDSPAQIKLTTRVGSVRPLYWGATRKVLLAFTERHDQDVILRRAQSELSDTELAQLTAELALIRAQGFAESAEELDEGAYAISAPILAPSGQLLAGVAVAGPLFRQSEESRSRFIELIRTAAHEVAQFVATGKV